MYLSRFREEQIIEMVGKVHFFYGSTEFKSDKAIIFDQQKIARLNGNVRILSDTLALAADSVAYYRIPELLNLGGNVYITETKPSGSFRSFNSQFGTYDKLEDKLTVWKDVRSYDQEEEAHAECGYAFWDRKAGYAYMIENPVIHTGKEDTLRISSEKMEFFDKERKLIATFNVQTQSPDYSVNSDFLIYFLKEDKAVFTGKPSFQSEFATATAEEFYMYLEDRKISSAELVDSCRVFFTEESGKDQTNWVEAEIIRLDFADDNIRSFIAEGKVSYYYLQEKRDKRDYFENAATGDFLEAKFNDDNKLDIMEMKKGIKGKYKFHNNS
jgi:lipopolysaccharide export system protein LptA